MEDYTHSAADRFMEGVWGVGGFLISPIAICFLGKVALNDYRAGKKNCLKGFGYDVGTYFLACGGSLAYSVTGTPIIDIN